MVRKRFILLFIWSISFSGFIIAQDITGNIEGWIVDSIGAPLYGVKISLQSEGLQGLRGTSTNEDGYFQMLALPIGSYTVKISYIGYQYITFENTQVRLGKTLSLAQIELNQQAINLPEITVSDKRMAIDPTSITHGGNLNSEDFENLPIENTSIEDIITF